MFCVLVASLDKKSWQATDKRLKAPIMNVIICLLAMIIYV